jgi:hypothetical protein
MVVSGRHHRVRDSALVEGAGAPSSLLSQQPHPVVVWTSVGLMTGRGRH